MFQFKVLQSEGLYCPFVVDFQISKKMMNLSKNNIPNFLQLGITQNKKSGVSVVSEYVIY